MPMTAVCSLASQRTDCEHKFYLRLFGGLLTALGGVFVLVAQLDVVVRYRNMAEYGSGDLLGGGLLLLTVGSICVWKGWR